MDLIILQEPLPLSRVRYLEIEQKIIAQEG